MQNKIDKANMFLKALSDNGAFLVSGSAKPNVMTIGWGSIMVMWGLPLMSIVVRQSRYTHEMLFLDPRFTVAAPKTGEFAEELMVCGTKSGRDADKFELCGLTPSKPRADGICGIEGCELNIECRSIHTIHMPTQGLPKELAEHYYPKGDEHTMYFGEILAIY